MKNILFVDLDDTVFQSLEKCASGVDLVPAAYLKDGRACSFMSPRQRAFLSFAQKGMVMIPTTARNLDAFRRVRIEWDSYAVLNYGGVILQPDGEPDAAWLERTRLSAQVTLGGLQAVAKLLDEYAVHTGFGGRARIIEDFSIPFYVVIKDPEKVHSRLEAMEEAVLRPWVHGEGADFYIHRNGNNLAVLPKTLNKANAVSHLCERLTQEHGDILTFGMGDSKSDARFMAACDYAIVPNGSQLSSLTLEAL